MEDNRDYQHIKCKSCGETKKRIRAGKRPASKETKFIGEDGLEWNGLVCGPCHKNKVKLKKQLDSQLIKQAKKLNVGS